MNKTAIGIIVAGFFTVFTAFAIRYSYGILLPEMLPALEITKAQAGIIYAAYFVAYTIFSPIFGLMADKYNLRLILTIFPALLCVGTFLMSWSSSLINASLFFALVGLGTASCWSPVVTMIPRWVSNERKGMALAFTDLGSALGLLVWVWVLPYIVEASSWTTGWTSLAAMALFATLVNIILVKNYPSDKSGIDQQEASKQANEPIFTTYGKLFRNNKFWLIGLSYLLIGFSILIPFTFITIHGVQSLAIPYQTAKWFLIVVAACGIIGKLILSHLSDKIGRIKIMIICDMLIAAGGLGMICSGNFLTLILSSAVFGFGYGALWPVYAAVTGDYFPKTFSGRIIGLWTLYLGVGSIFAPPLAGWTIDSSGTYSWAFGLTVASAVISLLLLLPLLAHSSKVQETGK
jgi:MFS family permease